MVRPAQSAPWCGSVSEATPELDARPARAESLAPRDLALSLLVGRSAASKLGRILDHAAEDPELQQLPITVIYSPDVAGRIRDKLENHPGVRIVEADGPSRSDLGEAFARDMPHQGTRYVAAVSLTKWQQLKKVVAGLGTEQRRLREIRLSRRTPVLLQHEFTPRQVVAAYVRHARSRLRGPSPVTMDYLGSLTLAAAAPCVEAVDPRGDGVQVRVWLNTGSEPEADQPSWRFRIVLAGGPGKPARSGPVQAGPRVDKFGVYRWDDVVAHLPLTAVSSGNHQLAIELVTDTPTLRTRRELQPRQGALLSGRTVTTQPGGPGTPSLRYLVHTAGRAKLTHLTVQFGTGIRAALHWTFRMVKKDLAFILRGPGPRRLRLLRGLRLVTLPLFARRQIWLVGERSDTAQDNGLHLFRHLRTEHPKRPVYYVIDPASPQIERVRDLGNIVVHSSWQHRLLMLHAQVLANAYSIHYMIPRQWDPANYARYLAWRVGALRVYLKHGVHLSPNAVKRGSAGYDVVLTVTPRETQALAAVSGYQEQLVETGLPRYDALTPTPPSRTVLFMSTWRRYLVPKVFGGANQDQIPFEGSTYEQFMSALLASPRLQEMLDRHDYRLMVLPHYNLAHHFAEMPRGDRIALADTDQSRFQDLIRNCDAFITDYSSVHFDVAYLGTPIIYSRFDEHDFETRHAAPSWFDYDNEGYGPVARTLTGTLDELERLLRRECAPDPVYTARIKEGFTYQDRNNCARAVAAIETRLVEARSGSAPRGAHGDRDT